MLSGGRDSVCLLDVAVSLRGAGDVQALHVNYGLRPEADGDERHCAELCERLGVALEVVRARRPGESSGNLQAWARELRYGAARRLGEQRDAVVATGHTATDQVETILYRLAASPGRRALLGMAPREGRVVRPLLELTREQTAAYCRARGLGWREDASNETHRYARGRVRHGLVPALRAVHPAAEANVLRTARLLREEAELLDGLVEAELRGAPRAPGHLDRAPRELSTALARLVVVRLAEDAAGTFVPQAGARVPEILALARRGGRAELHVGGLVARRGRGRRAAHGEAAATVLMRPYTPPVLAHPNGARPTASGGRRGAGRRGGSATAGRELAQEISRDYAERPLLLVGVLKGAMFFLSDLMRLIEIPVEVDFMAVASYGSATDSSGVVRILKDLDVAIEGRDVLIVEDIVDSGLTLQYLLRNLGSREPRTLEVCALLTKPERRKVDLPTRYVGFEIPDRFVIGYGLDHAERYRNLPFVAALEQ